MADSIAQSAAPPPIPGTPLDPPPKQVAQTVRKVEQRSGVAAGGYRAFLRFSFANASLLAAGTTYYVFLSIFAIVVFAFGVTALLGADQLAGTLTDALSNAFPGLVGSGGLDAEELRRVGQTTSVVGLLVLVYSASGAMVAASGSMHVIYGAPKDPRNFVHSRARLLGWMLVIAPLILLSFVPSLLVSGVAEPLLEAIGLDLLSPWLLLLASTAVSLCVSFLVMWLMLGVLGGIAPPPGARLIGAAVGAVSIEILKNVMSNVVSWAVAKPQYGAFAAPIAVLLVLYLQCLVLYASASLTAGIAEQQNAPTPTDG